MSRIVWEFFFCSLHFKYLFKVSEMIIFLLQKDSFTGKNTSNQSWKLF